MSWSTKFDEPIALAKGKALRTLRDAGHYIAALPKATQLRLRAERLFTL
jgi:hypothetical protein